ncbi:MAG: S-adenosylmethionine:tRNA ribosyltransferase-isomerase [Actinomycetota bacterium]|nr:S-adenosylmethionine:tRNA ribosyltransferase-isomerase [Actinomycetota bacterium]
MTVVLDRPAVDFHLPPERIADGPLEAGGGRRHDARMLVAWRSTERLVDARAVELPRFLRPGDVLVVNTSATLPAAVPTLDGRLLHLSTELPGGLWVVELRLPCRAGSLPVADGRPGQSVTLAGGGRADLVATFPAGESGPSRLLTATLSLPTGVHSYLARFGRPIRYGCPDTAWPLSDYQTVFATTPGSAEMASAARPFTAELVTSLVAAGVVFAPLILHTGVSSQEAGDPPYPERFAVPAATAEVVNAARANRHRVIAVGTTSARALETVVDESGRAHPGSGWTELVISPSRGVRGIDGLLTGWHEPEASHLHLLEAVAGRPVVERSYSYALSAGYRWHEFGDVHLVLP